MYQVKSARCCGRQRKQSKSKRKGRGRTREGGEAGGEETGGTGRQVRGRVTAALTTLYGPEPRTHAHQKCLELPLKRKRNLENFRALIRENWKQIAAT